MSCGRIKGPHDVFPAQAKFHFVALLQHILHVSKTLLPEQIFLNNLAKPRSPLLLERVNDLFV